MKDNKNALESVSVHQSRISSQMLSVENEINLCEIIEIFKKNRWLMFGIVFLVTLVTVVIVILLPKIYRAEVVINPPSITDVEQLNIFDIEGSLLDIEGSLPSKRKNDSGKYFYKIQEEELYDKFIRFLSSKLVQYDFFEENNLFDYLRGGDAKEDDSREVFRKKFSNKIVVHDLRYKNKNKLETITITLEGLDEKLTVEWLNKYVVYVDHYTIKSITKGITKKAQLQFDGISRQISILRDTEKIRRSDLIEQYKEALVVADILGINDKVSISFSPYNTLFQKKDITLDPGGVPLYLRGSDALQAGLSVLQQRKNDDPFISDLRDLQQRLMFLSHLNVEKAGVHSVSIDQSAFVSGDSVKPNRKLIIVIGFMFGCLLALFAALIKNWQATVTKR